MTSAGASFVGLFALLGAGLILAGLITGIVLLIIGLLKRRPGMWIGGTVCLIVSVVLIMGAAVLGVLAMFGFRSAAVRSAPVAVAVAPGNNVRESLGLTDNVPVPAGTGVVESSDVQVGAPGGRHYAVLAVSDGFEALLARHFTQTTWDQIKPKMTGPPAGGAELTGWDAERLESMGCYRRKYTDGTTGRSCRAYVCHDKEGRRAYCAREEVAE